MEVVNFYTGEPVQRDSSETEAESFASFGKYGYDQNYTNQMNNNYYMPNSNFQSIGTYGYNPYTQQPQMMYPPNNTGVGLGANPYYIPQQTMMYNNQYYQPMMNCNGTPYFGSLIQPSNSIYPNYFVQQASMNRGNNSLGFSPQYRNNQNNIFGDRVFIPGRRMTGEFLFMTDDLAKIKKLERQCNQELMEAEAIAIAQANLAYKGNGYDVVYRASYGAQEQSRIISKFEKLIDAIVNAARTRRREFELGLRKFAHKLCKDNVTDKQIEEAYDGHYMSNPTCPEYEEGYNSNIFSSKEEYLEILRKNKELEMTVPAMDSALVYQGIFQRASEEAQQFIDPNCKDLKDFLEQATEYNIFLALQKEDWRRQSLIGSYNNGRPSTYRDTIRAYLADRALKKLIKKANPDIDAQMEMVRNNNKAITNSISYVSDTEFYLNGMNNMPIYRSNKGRTVDGVPLPEMPPGYRPPEEIQIGDWIISGTPKSRRRQRQLAEQQQREAYEAEQAARSRELVDRIANSNQVDDRGVKCVTGSSIPGADMFPILANSGTTLAEDGIMTIKIHDEDSPMGTVKDPFSDPNYEERKEAFKDTIRRSLAIRPLHSGLLSNEVIGAE